MTAFQITHPFSGFSVDSIDAARAFYGDTLGLDVTTNAMGFLDIRLPDGGSILVYAKPDHTPASFTILNFPVDDVEAAVDDLNARGVVTKIYDDEIGTDAKGIMRGGPDRGPDIAWFRDPAGNVLSVLSAS
ncbi:VOC family protein [Microbacterium sp. kSW2-24]|uniref:VOC family protein n=1 Tax=Microbacterium galbinum TaxID=2851646 RepID=UPI001FFDB0EB|nr:VOC family protein [Microbacterium galbinum]MCK2022107.1 VOC family protein [Microbacterium galbinum]